MKFRKLISAFAVLGIVISGIIIPVSEAESDVSAPEDYLLNLTFDEEGTGKGSYAAATGGTVTEHGTVAYADGKVGKALSITEKSAGNYLSLDNGILSGKTAATYSFYLNAESDVAPNWAFMTTPESSHTYAKEKYVGMIATTSEYTVERYNNSGERISSVSSGDSYDGWKYVAVVIENNSTKLYVNGLLVASDSKPVDLSGIFTSASMTWLGHANWGSGEGFKGMIDEFRIYGRALEVKEIIALAGDDAEEEVVPLDAEPIVLEKSSGSNPMLGFDASGNILYAGDPAAFVDGDTVYLYAGHDDSPGEYYRMPNWECYSSKDMVNWKYEGVIMKGTDISWRVDNYTCWASQVIKYNGKYYFYWCTTNKNDNKYHSIGVAVSDSPTGPFTPLDTPIVKGYTDTPESTAGHSDIDPTVWVETVDGVEHRYLAWGNTWFHVCELNEDMTTGKDITGDGVFDKNDIKIQVFNNLPAGLGFTEAPWIYRRTDKNGNYVGKYYMFGAFGWREQMGYVTSDSMWGPWEWGGVLMPPTATSNTNHPSVIDFKGKTYFIYHNGSLPYGSGFHRVVCAEEFTFNEDGSIGPIQETSTGLTGTKSAIKQNDGYIYYENFINPSGDDNYPLSKNVYVGTGFSVSDSTQWEIVAGKADAGNENYVSIQAVNKPGLYLKAMSDKSVVLTQDSKKDDTATHNAMTFKTVKGLDGKENSVSFESVLKQGYYLSSADGALVIAPSTTLDKAACSFEVGSALPEGIITPLLSEITDAWIKDGKSVRFYLDNADVYESVCAYAAEYKDGKLLGVGMLDDIKVTSSRKSVVIPYERKAADSEIKIYVWKDMLPAAEASAITVTDSKYTMPDGYTSYFTFDGNMKDSKTTAEGILAATNIDGSAAATAASYGDGYSGKAIAFSGSGSYGVKLGNVITNNKYTVAFRIKANEFTACTSAIFINSGTKSSQKWVSAPFGDLSGGATKIWSTAGSGYLSVSSTESLTTGEWHHIAITADGGTASIYIDGVKTGSGSVADVVSSSTNTYLGVNFWDTPFNGLIDDLYIYNGVALDDESVTALYEATSR